MRRRSGEGISEVLSKPATALLMAANLFVAYRLWANHTTPEAVAISYAAFWEACEYWRAVTASFSHFEAMHLGFNMMSLWNLASLEAEMGSLGYLYTSLNLVVGTIIVVILIQHVLVRRGGPAAEAHRAQKAVGYSCVLFALMTCAAVREGQFCPVSFVPTFCFDTWFLPFKGALHRRLGFNFGPFALLFLVQFIMPRAGFLGHLSGILVGYPLAWGLLDGATPPLVVAACAVSVVWHGGFWPWRMPDYTLLLQVWQNGDDARVAAARAARRVLLAQAALLVPLLWLFTWHAAVAEALAAVLGWAAGQALRCCCCPDSVQAEHRCCVGLVKAWAAAAAVLLLGDMVSL
ncbi:unnamed protein product, partial [Phaeothamnion confervicola]